MERTKTERRWVGKGDWQRRYDQRRVRQRKVSQRKGSQRKVAQRRVRQRRDGQICRRNELHYVTKTPINSHN